MVKSIAEKHGLRATFMPKPFAHLTGNGCHAHVSAWDPGDEPEPVPRREDEMGLSKLAYQFLGGVLHHAEALCALTNPCVNSYKRINAPVTTSGATWSPNAVTWTATTAPTWCASRTRDGSSSGSPTARRTRTCCTRASSRPGSTASTTTASPGKPSHVDMYAEGHKVRARRLPLYLLDAIRAFDKDKALKAALGNSFSASYVKLKMQEWDEYSKHLTEWERTTTLDC